MDELLLGMRIFLSTLFISTALSKMKNFKNHVSVISSYKIFPDNWSKLIAIFDMVGEFIIGLLLFIGYIQPVMLVSVILLLIGYSFAIAINLLKGRNNLSCGCGGITGDNNISWLLVYRNIFFIVVAVFVLINNVKMFSIDLHFTNLNAIFEVEYLPIILSTWMIAFIYLIINELIKIKTI